MTDKSIIELKSELHYMFKANESLRVKYKDAIDVLVSICIAKTYGCDCPALARDFLEKINYGKEEK